MHNVYPASIYPSTNQPATTKGDVLNARQVPNVFSYILTVKGTYLWMDAELYADSRLFLSYVMFLVWLGGNCTVVVLVFLLLLFVALRRRKGGIFEVLVSVQFKSFF